MRRLPCVLAMLLPLFVTSAHAGRSEQAHLASQACVALTFDDGPETTLTPRLLDILAREHVHATFFVVGKQLAYSPGLVKRAFQEGHEIGNHTFDHRPLTSLSDGEIVAEIELTDEAVMAETGRRPAVIRPPWGLSDARVERVLRKAGLWRRMAFWNFDSFDWLDDERYITSLIVSGAPPGAVVLMHDIHASTVAAVPTIIRTLKLRGFRFATLANLSSCLHEIPTDLARKNRASRSFAVSDPSVPFDIVHPLKSIHQLGFYLTHRFGS
ncbi:polysaccharide deacetylase family protein [Labrys sp. ZIDIC5]|uniref:polysaccharide deacetylase family protein n=1 Tax=Labrys sedimenti TaxID=3106036 RepID=UPI002ACA95CB|nr:polysaccharide deacetylase family protein [Labrys sp. ZIDIC5]MDZ5454909.1 polysaccharide deacetylase family protein [Labrys sp. ZIDIC5]